MKPKLPSLYKKNELLNREELNALIIKAQKGCLKSRNEIIERNLGLLPKDAYGYTFYKVSTIDFEDLYQEGVFGLIDAIKNFDVSKGFAFSTYAMNWVKQRMMRYVKNHAKAVRVPIWATDIRQRYERIKKNNLDRDQDFWIELLSKESGVSFDSITWVIKHDIQTTSLDKEIDEEGHKMQIAYDLFDDEFHQGLDYKHILKIISLLPERDRDILIMRYEGETLRYVGKKYGLSKEMIRIICQNSLLKIRAMMNKIIKNSELKNSYDFSCNGK